LTPHAAPGEDWTRHWLPPLLDVLQGGDDKLRAYVSAHALPIALAADPTVLRGALLALLRDGGPEPVPGTSRLCAFVCILRAARGMTLIGDLDDLLGVEARLALATPPAALLRAGVAHASEAVRIDVLELACVNPRASEPPGALELELAAGWLATGLRCTPAGLHSRAVALLGKLLGRVRGSVYAALQRQKLRLQGASLLHGPLRAARARC